MKLNSTIDLYEICAAGDSWLVHPPGLVTDTPQVRDMARRRLVKTSPDVDAGGPGSGRHKEKYDIQLVGREKVAQALLEKLGYKNTSTDESNGKKTISFNHPDGHDAEIVRNKSYIWQVKLNGPDEHHKE